MRRISYRGLSIALSLLLVSTVLFVSAVARADYAYVKSIALPKFGASFDYPWGVAVDAYDNVWVTDNSGDSNFNGSNCIREYSSDGTLIQKFGSTGTAAGQFEFPHDLAFDPSGNVWVVSNLSTVGMVQEFDPSGTFIKSIGTHGSNLGQLLQPAGITVDSAGNVWVGDSAVVEYNNAGAFLQTFGQFPFEMNAMDIAVDSTGNVWVADSRGHQILELTATGSQIQSIQPVAFSWPLGLTFDRSGNLWALWGTGKVYEFAGDGTLIQSFFPIRKFQ